MTKFWKPVLALLLVCALALSGGALAGQARTPGGHRYGNGGTPHPALRATFPPAGGR